MQENEEPENLSDSDVTFRGVSILLVLFLLAVIGFLITRDGFSGLGNGSFTDWMLVFTKPP